MNQKLSEHRLKKAKIQLKAAELLFDADDYENSLSRAYYAMFSAARALLATKSLDSKKHSGIISLFNKEFVKPSLVDKRLGKFLAEAKSIREESDYGDFVSFSQEEAEEQIKQAKLFIESIETTLKKTIT